MLKVIIMQGVSGAGKSTYIKRNFPMAKIVSADNYFINSETGNYEFNGGLLGEAHAMCLRSFVEVVLSWNNEVTEDGFIVVDNTNCTIAEIAPYAQIALAYGHLLKIIHLDVDPKMAAARNQHGVEEQQVFIMAEKIANSIKEFPPYWPRESIFQKRVERWQQYATKR